MLNWFLMHQYLGFSKCFIYLNLSAGKHLICKHFFIQETWGYNKHSQTFQILHYQAKHRIGCPIKPDIVLPWPIWRIW